MLPLRDDIATDRPPYVVLALIAVNVLVYFAAQDGGLLSGSDAGIDGDWGVVPYELTHPGEASSGPHALATVFSSMFMHASVVHLGGNMLFLWIFGTTVEDSLGRLRFLAFYLVGGMAAIGAQTLVEPNSDVPTIGASGAVAAVLGGYLLQFPRGRVVTLILLVFFVTVIEIPATAVLLLWFGQQVLFGLLDLTDPAGDGGGVAYFAHIGGFAAGFLLIRLFATRRKEPPASPSNPIPA